MFLEDLYFGFVPMLRSEGRAAVKILVVGVARSGTSFLGEIFRQNAEIAYIYEPFWGHTFFAQWQCFWLKEDDLQPEAEKLLREVFNGQFDELQRQQPAPQNANRGFASRREELTSQLRCQTLNAAAIVIKEIRLNMHLRWVWKVIGPELRIVHLVRDARGVAASFLLPSRRMVPPIHQLVSKPIASLKLWTASRQTLYAEWRGWSEVPILRRFSPAHEEYARLLEAGGPHQRIAARWAVMMAHAISDSEAIPVGQYLRVRYEDLCRNPIAVSNHLYQFLDLPMPKPVEEWIMENTRRGNREERYSTSRKSLEMIDNWKSELSKRQVQDIEAICRPLMTTLGYDHDGY